jgi:WD40 repeat protein
MKLPRNWVIIMQEDADPNSRTMREGAPTVDGSSSSQRRVNGVDESTGSGRLEVRCPVCHAPMEVAVDTALTDLTCSSCGSHFSLVDQTKATHLAPALTRLGRFELIERLGVGGFGSVWKARDKELDRTVAIKIPRAGAMTSEEQEKFFREARAAAQLRHPSIVSVHEVGRDGDSVYIVSDFIRGATLGDWLTGQQLTNCEAAELCAKIADALHHAHENGIVHRDLKPANIMMDGDNQPHLMDFGLARREVGEVTVTMDGQVLGTPAYMSPELARGEAHTADRRSDVYSLGVILFQLLTGELPFRGNARMLIKQVIDDEPPSPRKLNANVKRDLETIALHCLQKSPEKRYKTARELADDLRRYIAGEPIYARPIGHIERSWRWILRHPTTAALCAVLLLILLSASTIAPLIAAHQAGLRHAAEDAESLAHNEAALAAREANRASHEAERATREAAASQRLANFVGAKYALTQDKLQDAFQQIAAAMKSEPAWEYGRILSDIVDQSRRDWQLLVRIPVEQRPGWGWFVGSGPRWLVLAQANSIKVRSPLRERPLAEIPIAAAVYASCPVGEDRLAVATGNNKIAVISLPNLEKVAECDFPGKIKQLCSHPRGEYFVGINTQGLLRIFDRNGYPRGERQFTPAPNARANFKIDLSPSGHAILFDNGQWNKPKTRWLWQTDRLKSFDCYTHFTRLRDDNIAVGYSTGSITTNNVLFRSADIEKNEQTALCYDSGFIYADGAILTGDFPAGFERDKNNPAEALSTSVQLPTSAASKSPWDVLAGMAMANSRGINVFKGASPREGLLEGEGFGQGQSAQMFTTTRFLSLWPHTSEQPQFLAFAGNTLAVSTDHEVLIFARWLPAHRSSSLDLTQSFWSINAAENFVYAMSANTLQVVDFNSFEQVRHPLQQPIDTAAMSPETGRGAGGKEADKRNVRMLMPWGVAAAPSAHRVAVLWQEADDWGTISGNYFRKFVSIYNLNHGFPHDQPHVLNQFELKAFFGAPGRTNRGLWLSPDGNVLAFFDSRGVLAGYSADNGQQLYRQNLGPASSVTASNDSKHFAIGNFAKPTSFKILDLATGKTICTFALDAPLVRSAFSSDGSSVYTGLASKIVRQYRVRDGTLLTEFNSPAAPIAVSPMGNRYLGFVPDAPTVGSLVLADLRTGRILETINPNSHVNNASFFSPDGKSFASVVDRDVCRVMTTLDTNEASLLLGRAAVDPILAASGDLVSYRETMATNILAQAKTAAQRGDRSAALEAVRKSIGILHSLYAENETVGKYATLLAASYEYRAELENDESRKHTLHRLAEEYKNIGRTTAKSNPSH